MATKAQNEDALEWAVRIAPFRESTRVTSRPWATTHQLSLVSGGNAFLKCVKPGEDGPVPRVVAVASAFGAHTAKLLGHDVDGGFLLAAEHGGVDLGRDARRPQKLALLRTYAAIQKQSCEVPLPNLPTVEPARIVDDFLSFLNDNDTGVVRFLGAKETDEFRTAFSENSKYFNDMAEIASQLPQTLNHCDLRPQNAAELPDGSLAILDWDDAVNGPIGLSLHALFSGCSRPARVLAAGTDEQSSARDARYMSEYLTELDQDTPEFRHALAGSVVVGVLHALTLYQPHGISGRKYQASVSRVLRKRMTDCLSLVAAQPKRAAATATTATKQRSIEFPAIEATAKDHARNRLAPETRQRGVELFRENGTLLIRNALPPAVIDQCRKVFLKEYEAYLEAKSHDDALRVGDRRYMITLKFQAPFNNELIFASPFVRPILKNLLGSKHILGSFTSVASLPGAQDQRMHKDHPALFKENTSALASSFAVTMMVPLIDLNPETGATGVVSGSHVLSSDQAAALNTQSTEVPVGSCFLMDYRLSHHGAANRSKMVRPVLSYVFHRPWFRDYVNYTKQKPLHLTKKGLAELGGNRRQMVAWAE